MIVAWFIIALITASALAVIVHMLRSEQSQTPRTSVRLVRASPFVLFAAWSLWVAQRAPRGRKPFSADLSLDRADLIQSMTKVPHLVGSAIFLLLAVIAFGTRRLDRAFLATMLVGLGWEIGELTVVGHYARLTDLAPDLTGAIVALALVASIRSTIDGGASRPSPIAEGDPRT